jgi:hypothetical protein
LKAKVIANFHGLVEDYPFKINDIIEATPERIDKLEAMELVQRLEHKPSEYKIDKPKETRGRPRKRG